MKIKATDIESKVDFSSIRRMLEEKCLFSMGEEYVSKMQWSSDRDEVTGNLQLTNEFLQIIRSSSPFPNSNYFDYRESLNALGPDGTYLDEGQVWELYLSLKTIIKIRKYLVAREEDYPGLNSIVPSNNIKELSDLIEQKFNETGVLRDNASSDLSRIRKQIKKVEGSINKLISQVFNEANSKGYVPEGMSVSIRNGRAVIPVSSEHKRKVKGIIQDYSATGSIIFMEPDVVQEATNRIQDLHHDEKKEVVRLLVSIADEIRKFAEELRELIEFLGLMDFMRAKALLATELNATLPKIVNGGSLEIVEGYHPLLLLQGKDVIPLSLRLDTKQRILLISGPNAGGKSVALKTAGLFQYMLQCGLLIPAHEDSKFRVFDSLFIDIGDQQSLENDLSTYSSHLKNMREIIDHANEDSLVLIDEFGSGTDPLLGGAIAESVLEELVKNKCWGIITTHYSNLKQFAEKCETMSNGAMLFDKKNLIPYFILEQGRQGGSFALEVASKTGLPENVIERAKELAGTEAVSLEEILAKLDKERKELSNKLSNLSKEEKEAKSSKESYLQLKEDLERRQKELLNEASKKAESLLSETNREIEKVIRHIKENKAEKKETRKIRSKLDQFRKENQKSIVEKTSPTPSSEFLVSDIVEIKNQGVTGEILELRGKEAIVLVGNIRTKIKLSELTKTGKKTAPQKASSYQFDRGVHRISNSIDVRGKRADEAIGEVDKFIDDALIAGLNIISVLHGKGNGILRKVIRDHIKSLKQVEKFADEHVERGGDGITVIYLK